MLPKPREQKANREFGLLYLKGCSQITALAEWIDLLGSPVALLESQQEQAVDAATEHPTPWRNLSLHCL